MCMIPKSRILTVEMVNGEHPINFHVGFPIFLGHHYPRVMMAMGRCGHIIGFDETSNAVKVYCDGFAGDSPELVKHLDAASEDVTMKLFNNHSLFLMDIDTIDELVRLRH